MLIACHCVTDFLKHHYNTLLSECQYFLKTDSSPKGQGKGATVNEGYLTSCIPRSGIGRSEEMCQKAALHHAEVQIIPRVALSQSVREANNDC